MINDHNTHGVYLCLHIALYMCSMLSSSLFVQVCGTEITLKKIIKKINPEINRKNKNYHVNLINSNL